MTDITDKLAEALRELVACKDSKDEESRLRQRRENSRFSGNREALKHINAMRDDYNRRKPLAWDAARKRLALYDARQPASAAPATDAEVERLIERVKEYGQMCDRVGRSRGVNCYAHDTDAVVQSCNRFESIAHQIRALAASRSAAKP